MLTARKLLQTKNHDVEMSLRGVLRGFGLKVGPTTPRTFASRVRELVAGHPTLSTIAEALLAARGTLFEQWQQLEKRLRSLAREDRRVRLVMTAPGVGAIVGLTYASAIDDPGRFRSSKTVGAHFGLAGQGLDPEELGNAPGGSRRYAQGQGRACPQARRGAASDAGRRDGLYRRQGGRRRSPLTKGDLRFGRFEHRPPAARSRRWDDGPGQTDDISAGHCYCALLDWPTCSSSDPIRWRPGADPGQKKDPGDRIKAQGD